MADIAIRQPDATACRNRLLGAEKGHCSARRGGAQILPAMLAFNYGRGLVLPFYL